MAKTSQPATLRKRRQKQRGADDAGVVEPADRSCSSSDFISVSSARRPGASRSMRPSARPGSCRRSPAALPSAPRGSLDFILSLSACIFVIRRRGHRRPASTRESPASQADTWPGSRRPWPSAPRFSSMPLSVRLTPATTAAWTALLRPGPAWRPGHQRPRYRRRGGRRRAPRMRDNAFMELPRDDGWACYHD